MSDASPELLERLEDLEERVEDLEAQRDAYDDLIELRGVDDPQYADIKDIWIGGVPVGKAVSKNRDDVDQALDEIADLKADEIDAADVATESEHLLPIQRRLRERQAGDTVTPANLHRATYVWEEFYERAIADSGLWKLSSAQVKRILECAADDLEASRSTLTNSNTVGRVMEMVATATGPSEDPESEDNLVTLRTAQGTKMLVADRDEWAEWADSLSADVAGVADDADEADTVEDTPDDTAADGELDRLTGAEAVTDDEADTVETTVETTDRTEGDITVS
jgi:hypothetical protein